MRRNLMTLLAFLIGACAGFGADDYKPLSADQALDKVKTLVVNASYSAAAWRLSVEKALSAFCSE